MNKFVLKMLKNKTYKIGTELNTINNTTNTKKELQHLF